MIEEEHPATTTRSRPVRPSWADPVEIDTFDEFVERFWRGEISPDEFKRFRLQNGIYGQKQEGQQMVRVKVPWGGLTADQLDLLRGLGAPAAVLGPQPPQTGAGSGFFARSHPSE